MLIGNSIVAMWNGNFDTSTWALAYHSTVPFDTTAVYGWYLHLFMQWIFAMFYVFTKTAASTFYISSCIYIESMCHHFEHSIRIVETLSNALPPKKGLRPMHIPPCNIKAKLIEAIGLHIKISE